ncbi:hypothetical protein [Commensalibacter communis]|uniref:hypothetical protein n=1 Tax=Commensalibacter communis TaxID=2972786 RepID=UPI0022FF80E5|nr:hypothetical protein [Commensalibacter communis]CAI3933421.1 unnamed protein product [Commensalibacter communis]CAI3944779.1 unnamed protein product [Commensalibacter communis]
MFPHDIVHRIISIVNPNVTALVKKSKGFSVGQGGVQIPLYEDSKEITVQVQSAEGVELTHVDNINMQGERKIVFSSEQLYGIDRVRGLGGDLLEFYGRKWLVVKRIEGWEGSKWCKVLVIAQLDEIEDDTDGINDYDERD